MRQRVSIARAFATPAPLLLCDEPFSALDEITAQRLREEFVALVRETGRTAIFITHAIPEALQIGERILVMRPPGQIAFETRISAVTSEAERGDIRRKIHQILGE
jgi:NitT/TauT family transport system ATP-binding protein